MPDSQYRINGGICKPAYSAPQVGVAQFWSVSFVIAPVPGLKLIVMSRSRDMRLTDTGIKCTNEKEIYFRDVKKDSDNWMMTMNSIP